jgi:hypothetical protein
MSDPTDLVERLRKRAMQFDLANSAARTIASELMAAADRIAELEADARYLAEALIESGVVETEDVEVLDRVLKKGES